MLPNLRITGKDIGDIQATIYCSSQKTGVKVIPVVTKQKRYTPDRYLELNELNYAIVDDGSSVSLGAYGDTEVCFQSNFKYNMKSKSNNVMIFNAVSQKTMQFGWFEDYFQFPMSFADRFKRLVLLYNIFAITCTKNLHWKTIWERKAKFHILIDTATKTFLDLQPFGTYYDYKELEIDIEELQILIGSRQKYWVIFLKYQTPKEFVMTDFMRTIIYEEFGYAIADIFNVFKVNEIFKPNSVGKIFFQMTKTVFKM